MRRLIMSRLIWLYVVWKSLSLLTVALKELIKLGCLCYLNDVCCKYLHIYFISVWTCPLHLYIYNISLEQCSCLITSVKKAVWNLPMHIYPKVRLLILRPVCMPLGIFSRRQIGHIFLIFSSKQDLTFYANCLDWKQFAWNVKTGFLRKLKEIFENAEILTQSAKR